MSIKLNVGGIEVTVSNAAEAAAVLRELDAAPKERVVAPGKPIGLAPGKKAAPPSGKPIHAAPDKNGVFEPKKAAMALLQAVRTAGPQGLARSNAMPILQSDHPKGVGGRMVAINRVFEEHGINPERVLNTSRLTDRGRVWYPGSEFTEALEKLSR